MTWILAFWSSFLRVSIEWRSSWMYCVNVRKYSCVLHVSKPYDCVSLWLLQSEFWSEMKRDNPLNLSILIRGGKETNKDSPSNGEWSGKSSIWKSISSTGHRVVAYRRTISCNLGISSLEWGIIEGENPVYDPKLATYDVCSLSRVVWDCSSKWVVSFI